MRIRLPALALLLLVVACRGDSDETVRLPARPAAGKQGLELPPVPLNANSPVTYPPALASQGIEGTVLLRLYVDTLGRIQKDSTRIAESLSRARQRRAPGGTRAALRPRRARRAAHRRPLPPADPLPYALGPWSDPMTFHSHPKPYDDVLQTIGWTPLIRLSRIGAGLRTPIYGKAEYQNPGGSVKDRIGVAMIEAAEQAGELKPGGTIVEGTSGNTGVGLAMAAALKGYRCIFTMPDKMSQEKVKLLKAYGAEVVITPTAVPPDHPDNYIMKAKQIVHDTPGAILANQHFNQVNPEAHYATTGPEIWEQTEGRVTHFVAGAGTGGTVSGAGKYLKEQNPGIRIIAGDPVGSLYTGYAKTKVLGEGAGAPYKVEGVGGDKISSTIWFDWIDEWRQVPDRASMMMSRRLAREEGILIGGSGGLNVALALEIARELDDPKAYVVTILCDTGERYLSKVFSDEWMQENQLLEKPQATVEQLLQRRSANAPADLVSVAPAAAVRQALNLMSSWEVSQLPVVDDGEVVGGLVEQVLMTRDLAQPSLLDRPVREVMEAPFPVVEHTFPTDRLAPMLTRDTPAALVRKDGRLIGIVSRYDVLQQLIGTR
jgi:cystathionine beta-synthase